MRDKLQFSWTTFQGKQVSFDTVDHQHLSNLIWYWKVLHDLDVTDAIAKLSERFNGQLLPYRPHVDFKYEIDALKDRGMIVQPDDAVGWSFITYKGTIIGEIRTFPTELFLTP